jgi:hypothetical protein
LRLRAERPAIVVLASGVLAGSWGVLHLSPFHVWIRGDILFYENWGTWIAAHLLPYGDFKLEYPPGSIPVFALPVYLRKLAGYHWFYPTWFRVEMLACGILMLVGMALALRAVRAGARHLAGALLFAALSPLALGPVSIARYDLVPAMITAFAVAALVSGRNRLAVLAIALGAVVKLYPAVLLPIALVDAWRRRGMRGVAQSLAIFVGLFAIAFTPFLVLTPHGIAASVRGQAERPLQIESIGAAGFLAAHQLAGTYVRVVQCHGSDNIAGAAPKAVATLCTVLVVVALVAVWVVYARRGGGPEETLAACAAAVTAYIAFNKVFSPQYLIWLVPLVPLVRGRRGLWATVLLGLSLLLTQLWEPYSYVHLITRLDAQISWFVVVRDLVTVALFAVLIAPERLLDRHAERLAPRGASVVPALD